MQSKIKNRKSGPSGSAPTVGAERVRAYIRSRFNPIRSLTPELLSQYLDAFKTGYLRQCALVWDAIEERDDTLAGVIAKRKAAAARHGWEIVTLDSVPEAQKTEAETHKEALENFYNNLTVVSAIDENERGEVSLLLRQMMDAVGKKYAVHEIIWRPTDQSDPSDRSDATGARRAGLTAELRFVPLWFFEHITGRLRYLQTEGALEGVDMADDAWLVSVAQGLMPACSVAYIYKTMSLKDWVIYNERHGMPGIHGKTDAAQDSDEWNALVTAVQNFAADWALVTNSGATIEKVDMATTGQLPYPPLVERMDRAMAALWRGADLSTISGVKSDAGQGASLQGDESEILEQDDAQWLSETLSRQLDKRVIEYVFGEGTKPLAYIKIKTSQKKNIAQELLVDTFLRDSGAPLGVDSVLERYGRPTPDADDQLLVSPMLPAGGAQNPAVPLRLGTATPAQAAHLSGQGRTPAGLVSNSADRSDLSDQSGPSSGVSRPASVSEAVAATLGVRSEWLAPFFAQLEAKAQDKTLTDAELLAAIENMAKSLPELLTESHVQDVAAVVQKTLTAGLVSGLTTQNKGN